MIDFDAVELLRSLYCTSSFVESNSRHSLALAIGSIGQQDVLDRANCLREVVLAADTFNVSLLSRIWPA